MVLLGIISLIKTGEQVWVKSDKALPDFEAFRAYIYLTLGDLLGTQHHLQQVLYQFEESLVVKTFEQILS